MWTVRINFKKSHMFVFTEGHMVGNGQWAEPSPHSGSFFPELFQGGDTEKLHHFSATAADTHFLVFSSLVNPPWTHAPFPSPPNEGTLHGSLLAHSDLSSLHFLSQRLWLKTLWQIILNANHQSWVCVLLTTPGPFISFFPSLPPSSPSLLPSSTVRVLAMRRQDLQSLFWHAGSLITACGIKFPEQGSNLGLLHWKQRVLATGTTGEIPTFYFKTILNLQKIKRRVWRILLYLLSKDPSQILPIVPITAFVAKTSFQHPCFTRLSCCSNLL